MRNATSGPKRPGADRHPSAAQPFVSQLLFAVAIVGLSSGMIGCNSKARSKELLVEAKTALKDGDQEEAEKLALKSAKADPDNGEAWVIAGNAARDAGENDRALEHYGKTPSSDKKFKTESHVRAATVNMESFGRLTVAESEFRKALALNEGHVEANDGLAFLLSISGRRWESAAHFLVLIRRLEYEMGHLFAIGNLETTLHDIATLTRWADQNPDDPLPRLGLARIAIDERRFDDAQALLESVIDDDPNIAEAQGRLGQVLAANADFNGLIEWNQQLPDSALKHPEVWVARAEWRVLLDDNEGAARCFAESLRLNPNLQQSAFQLVRVLNALGDSELALTLEARARQLLAYQEILVKLQGNSNSVRTMIEAANLAEGLGRYWEARGWLRLAKDLDPANPQYNIAISRLNETLTNGPPLVIPRLNPIESVELTAWSMPQWETEVSSDSNVVNQSSEARIQFAALGEAQGLDFQYYNGRNAQQPGPLLFQVDGGGVGVLDFDLDGRPDLWFTQGCEFPELNPMTPFVDRVYRNVGGDRVVDVTAEVGVREAGFGQGIACGDFNNDGFPDVLVANIGENRLFLNMGDGTFEDVTLSAGLMGAEWTASAVIADLNADGLPDIYEVNYLKGHDIHERVCPDAAGTPRICPPLQFEAELDKVYLNSGNGRFVDASAALGIHAHAGKGLGIVVADFDQTGQVKIFVANDVVNNFYWRPTTDDEGNLIFEEIATLNGLATDYLGQSQACMGVAADDLNNNGFIDMLVTNFHEETNCLYMQTQGGLFADQTARSLLARPSFPMLGFGTQFIDGDRDGNPDLVVANGHLVDETDLGVPYRMRPQFFRQIEGHQFQEVSSGDLGTYFQTPQLGRGLATLDFDRDAKEDFVVTDLESPASLQLNRTESDAFGLNVRLIATSSARDAIGAQVTVVGNAIQRSRQLTAGSGYQASNEKILNFGLGEDSLVRSITVRWPSGDEQTWFGIESERTIVLIEGDDQFHTE